MLCGGEKKIKKYRIIGSNLVQTRNRLETKEIKIGKVQVRENFP